MGDEFLIAALVCAIACLVLVLYLQKQSSKLKTKVDALTVLVKESDRQREAVKRELHELRSGTIGVGRRVVELEKKLSKQSDMLEEAITTVRNELTEKVDDYLSYVVEQWMNGINTEAAQKIAQ